MAAIFKTVEINMAS